MLNFLALSVNLIAGWSRALSSSEAADSASLAWVSSSLRQMPMRWSALCTCPSEKHLVLRLSARWSTTERKYMKTSLSMILDTPSNCGVNLGSGGGGVHSGSPSAFRRALWASSDCNAKRKYFQTVR